MRRFPGLLIALLSFFAFSRSQALSPDPRLLSLVSPGAQIVAGVDSAPPKGSAGSFVLMTHNNRVDMEDVLALTGADSSRSVSHALFVARDDVAGYLNEHSLLMSGRFDQARIYKSAMEGGARTIRYRGVPVLVIQPFVRERREMDDVRWLAVVNSDVLLFGSVPSVCDELDRYLARSAPDPLLVRKLGRLRRDDATWTVTSAPTQARDIRKALMAIDSQLAELAANGDTFQFGIHYGRVVELEYEAGTASSAAENDAPGPVMQSFVGPGRAESLFPSLNTTKGDGVVRGVVKIPAAKFNSWLEHESAP